jgi:BirA family biotin operon repressor/biotin-[acetyl-CoA-carboxylase] ligase
MPLLDPVALRPLLGAYAGRFDVDALAICDSTSSELLRRADAGAPSGSVLVADAAGVLTGVVHIGDLMRAKVI